MLEDKERWNLRHVEKPMPGYVSPTLTKYIKHAKVGRALDIACGTGRNTHYLADLGFIVDALDLSDYALSRIREDEKIVKSEVDLDTYDLKHQKYDLVLNINYLNRRLTAQIKDALKQDGLVIFETFIVAHDSPEKGSMNPDYLLKPNELSEFFSDFNIIYYEEKDIVNLRGEDARLASLVARKQ
ncbi:methyltransferase domain-containing protein [Sulfurimonas sp. HSL-1716]|uniref:class I SAM-dependent methyltransferase n=1 Tax=Hydrocurvibacter sulfurireducens TaxID=3131937 RepID=UPI0031F7261D